jgi:hypothetical protein
MASRRNKNDCYLLFKKDVSEDSILNHEVVGKRFYACDYIDFSNEGTNFIGMQRVSQNTLTINTSDMIDVEPDDYIMTLNGNDLWIVTKVVIADSNTNKRFSSRPRKETYIWLRK